MTKKHVQTFFGQATALTLQSSARTDPFIFLQVIKKKAEGDWEKPSNGEGRTIKCSLTEIVMILEVLKKNRFSWETIHNYKEIITQISFQWDDNYEKLWIKITNYSKMLDFAQVVIFKMLLEHILCEKIEYATGIPQEFSSNPDKQKKLVKNKYSNPVKLSSNSKSSDIQKKSPNNNDKLKIVESIENSENKNTQNKNNIHNNETKTKKINGIIKRETNKALLIEFGQNKEVWIPKSRITSHFNSSSKKNQNFLIESWILKKNKIMS
ncbi:MAG: hypothetical protein GF317_10225 [Candidatus Lokiarchaeota archaeon]|nr:hypothetical protein [Candidatus Lokiarchaeota archaeon]MBD3200036.1 hypothetical protein [Candidatus Lokiarchaeota archaeon]